MSTDTYLYALYYPIRICFRGMIVLYSEPQYAKVISQNCVTWCRLDHAQPGNNNNEDRLTFRLFSRTIVFTRLNIIIIIIFIYTQLQLQCQLGL